MSTEVEITINQSITLTDEQMESYRKLLRHAPGLTLEELIAEERAAWWDQLSDPDVEARFVDLDENGNEIE